MKIRVKLFAAFRELAGARELEVEVDEGTSAEGVFRLLRTRYPGFSRYEDRLAYAVNACYAEPSLALQPGDELALIPPVSGGQEQMFRITHDPIATEPLVAAVSAPGAGAVAVFHGVVRDNNLGRRVLYLEYDGYPEMCASVLSGIEQELRGRWPVIGFAAAHRLGRVEIGEASLLVAVSTPHRAEAFEACRYAVDRIKVMLPVWKKEVFEGGEVWIEGEAGAAPAGTP